MSIEKLLASMEAGKHVQRDLAREIAFLYLLRSSTPLPCQIHIPRPSEEINGCEEKQALDPYKSLSSIGVKRIVVMKTWCASANSLRNVICSGLPSEHQLEL